MSEAWTIGRLLQWTSEHLKKHGSETPRLDAEVLLAFARGCQRIELYTSFEEPASDELRAKFRELVRQRSEGKPVAYLVGFREFYSRKFRVSPAVLIPRPETEFLVVALTDLIDELIHQKPNADAPIAVADVGTGSGIVAVCAARHNPRVRVTAIDISGEALAIAAQNVADNGVADRVTLVESDLFSGIAADQRYDFIASNPPYISDAEMAALPRDVQNYEPRLALAAGPTGAAVIERLIPAAAERLRPGGWLLLEISPMLEQRVGELVRADGRYELASTIKDLAQLPRIIRAPNSDLTHWPHPLAPGESPGEPQRTNKQAMDCFQITGGTPLHGSVAASGSKNAALPIMAAAILADEPVRLQRVPELADVATLSLVLEHLGVDVSREADGTLRLNTVDASPTRADYDLVRRMRASFCVLGPLLARRGSAAVSLPGGCNIGTRPVDLHLAGLAALGAEVTIEHGYVVARARRLVGATVSMRSPWGSTVTGTANVMSAASLARGVTTIVGAAREPEIVDLGNFLIALGALIDGLGSDEIRIHGVEQLGGATYRVIPDRIEAATLLIAAAITGGSATITGVTPGHLVAVIKILLAAGIAVEAGADFVRVTAQGRPQPIRLMARPYPGVPTDLQAQLTALFALANGTSTVRDAVFPERFMQVAELSRLGARIERRGGEIVIQGVARLSGANVMASDLRASASLVLAGLAAEGETTVRRIYHLDRGYERLENKLNRLGATIERRAENAQSLQGTPAFDSEPMRNT